MATKAKRPPAKKAPPRRSGRFRVLKGISYSGGKNAQPGDIVDDLPAHIIETWLAEGAIAPASSRKAGE